MTDTPTLRPCPHCGGSARLVSYTVDVSGKEIDWSVECENDECSAVMSLNYGADDVDATAATWNRRASAWIAVEERLPEKPEPALVVTENATIRIAKYWEKYRCWDEVPGSQLRESVTHWQPIPNPPEIEL